MYEVVFVAPFLMETTLRFVRAAAHLPDVAVTLLTQDDPARLPAPLAARLVHVQRVDDALDAAVIQGACESIAARRGRLDRILGTLEELQVPLGEVRDSLGLPGIGAAAAANFRDKARMKDVLQAAGLPCARHRRVTSSSEVWSFVDEIGFPLVFKPTAGSGSRGTFRIEDREQLESVLRWQEPSARNATMLEQFITGEEHSFDSVFVAGEMVWHSYTDYLPSPLEVLENPWIQWCVLLPRERARDDVTAFRPLAEQALVTLGMRDGLSHMEWFQRADGSFAISEVGARPPGAQITSIISYAHEFSLYDAWAELMVFERFEPPERSYAAGCAYLRGQGDGRVAAVHGLEQAQARVEGLVMDVRLPRRGQPRGSTYEGDGYVIVRHRETDAVHEALGTLLRTIRVELAG